MSANIAISITNVPSSCMGYTKNKKRCFRAISKMIRQIEDGAIIFYCQKCFKRLDITNEYRTDK
jgi:hypothetical protein